MNHLAQARLTVLHRLDEAKLWGAPDGRLDRLAAGLFYDARESESAGSRLDARAERLSVAATRLAFCASPATTRWLVQQEAALFASRLRLGEREVPDPSPSEEDDEAEDETSRRAESASLGDGTESAPKASRHRWVAFERASALIGRRAPGVLLRNGRARIPEALVPEVLLHDHRRETEAALAATARRRRHAEAEARGAGAFGTPATADVLAKLVTWRPRRPNAEETEAWVRAEREASRRHGFAETGSRAPVTEDLEDLAAPPSGSFFGDFDSNGAGREGRARTGWVRGWRRSRKDGGNAAPATSLSLLPDAGRAFGGADSAFGRLPAEHFAPPIGSDAKRALRVIRKGPRHAVAGARPFPLCVRRHLAGLHRDHHLRHEARFQLTLFFKGIDLSAEETLHVWRSQFGHGKMNDFQNEHRYHVRHAYGLEGKMADYPPFTCEKLARRKVTPDGAASCPFAAAASGGGDGRRDASAVREGPGSSRTSKASSREHRAAEPSSPADALREEIGALVPPREAARIVRVAAGGNAREACRMFFRATHSPESPESPESPDSPDEDEDEARSTFRAAAPARAAERVGVARETHASPDARSLEDLKFPHDYFDESARVEEAARRFSRGGALEAGAGASARVALEMEDDTDESDAEEGGDLPGHRDH